MTDPIRAVPPEVIRRLGAAPRDISRFGSARVLLGDGLVLKAGPEDRSAREAFVLRDLRSSLPLSVPPLVDAGDGWLLLEAVDRADSDPGSWRADALADLARLHAAFVDAPTLRDARLRAVTGSELSSLRRRSVALADELDLPKPLRLLAADPEPLLDAVRSVTTFVHGDAWIGNVLPTAGGGRCWIDWEEAGAGHPAIDLATWLYGSPWVPAAADPDRDLATYLAARTTAVDEGLLRHAIDAAVVVLFLLLDLPGLATWDRHERREIVDRRTAVAERFAR